MKYDLDYVKTRYLEKENLKYIFFWGHTETPGAITNACFSQWYPCTFETGEQVYHTAEQYMMARKALLFQDDMIFRKIMEAGHPNEYKALGRKIRNFSDEVWDAHKRQIVLEGNLAKFSQNPDLGTYLIQTGGRILVEASPYDKIWGIGMSKDHKDATNPLSWPGENLLGFILMEVRDKLRENMI